MKLSLIFLFIIGIASERAYLSEHRIPHWKTGDSNRGPFYGQPEQIHLSYGGDPSRVIVTWLTFDDTEHSLVEYGIGKTDRTVQGRVSLFYDGGPKKTKRFIHRAVMPNIRPGKRYFYRVGSEYGWSNIYTFVGLEERPDGGYKFAVYGDMGNINARSLGKIQRQAQDGDFDMILHVGDFAYDMDTDNGAFGDAFMRQIEPAAAYIPYMTVVGNHEEKYNFSHYVNRFTMPNSEHNLWYSFDIGKAHFIAFSTELYFYYEQYGSVQLQNQYEWLKKDLERANRNRKNVPWIITLAHRAMYCSDEDATECQNTTYPVRVGLHGKYALESLFYKHGVDLEIWAHQHSYERLYPVFNQTVYKGVDNPYHNPPAPVHIVTGSAGCSENISHWKDPIRPWSAFRSLDYGFSRMQIHNSSHLYFEQIAAHKEESVDSFWLIKNTHKPHDHHDLKRLKKHGTHHKHHHYHYDSESSNNNVY